MLTNFPNTFTLLQIHIGDSYSTTWGNARWTFYAGTGTPTAWFDGVRSAVGASSTQQAYNTYLGHYNVRRATPTDVTIGLTGTQISGPMYTFRARVGVEAGGTSKTMRIHIAQVRDRYPSSPSYSRYCFRQAAAYQDVTVAAGQFAIVSKTLTINADDWAHSGDVKIIAWAQVPTTAGPANVYNAAQMNWPFSPDCNANGIPDAQDIAGGTSTDCNGNAIPDECETDLVPEIAENPAPQNGFVGETVNFVVTATGYGTLNYQWRKDSVDLVDGGNISGATTASLTIGPLVAADAGGYDVVVTSSCGTDTSDPVALTVWVRGDLNCDTVVNFSDINPFVTALTSQDAYEDQFPDCNWLNGDCNLDGTVNFTDINPFVALLTGPP